MTGLYVASNVPALGAQFNLVRNMGELTNVLTRLSTGLRINSGKDDPAGLIASELLKAEITGTAKAISNTQRANSMIMTADSSLGQISNLLNDVKGLVVEAANTGAMSKDQIAANQLQVDATLESIDRIARTTTYAGQRLLDGSLDFRTSLTNAGASGIGNLQINSANFGNASAIDVDVRVLEAARNAMLTYNGTGVDQRTTIDVTGSVGSKSFTFGAGTTNDQMALAINAASDSTGVGAYVEGKAERGSVVLSTAGANNDILITANKVGVDAGNYTFRITQSVTGSNDVRVVSDPAGNTAGVVEISLVGSKEASYSNFAGLFNITIDADNFGSSTSVNMTRGNSNKVQFFDADSAASGTTQSGKTLTANAIAPTTANVRMSDLNGWSVVVDDAKAALGSAGTWSADQDNKTVYITAAAGTTANISATLNTAFSSVLGAEAALTGGFALTENLAAGDKLTLGNGGSAGELFIQYAAGATAGDIQKMINNAPGVQATLKAGVSASDVIQNLPSGATYASGAAAVENKYVSGATSQQVIDLINSKLGDMFTATSLYGSGSGGRVGYMDASVVYGDINLDNALVFSGMDNGPLVRLSTSNSDGSRAINQELSISILQPSDTDIRAGITTPILQVNLATDAAGNSISTAKDIADMFNRLTAAETLGVSASVLYPPGVDPNGRVWVDDGCGNEVMFEDCPAPFGLGIVQPTGYPDDCGMVQNDLVLLGNNQKLIADYASASIAGTIVTLGTAASTAAAAAGGGTFTVTASAIDGTKGNVVIAFDDSVALGENSWAGATLTIGTDGSGAGTWADGAAFAAFIEAALNTTPGGPGATFTVTGGGTFTSAAIATGTFGTVAGGTNPIFGASKAAVSEGTAANQTITFGQTSALNGVTFVFTQDETKEGFNKDTGTLTVFLNPEIAAKATGDQPEFILNAINSSIAANWEGIRAFTGSTLLQPGTEEKASALGSAANTVALLTASTFSTKTLKIGETAAQGGVIGIGANDPAVKITAKDTGTDMAGVKIFFVQDNSMSTNLGELDVQYKELENGEKQLIVKGNAPTIGAMAADLVAALNSNADFTKLFEASVGLPVGTATGDPNAVVMFGELNTNNPNGVTEGGYKIESTKVTTTGGTTSSGISMFGQSDSNERLVLQALEAGSDNFVKVAVAEGSFDTYCRLGNRRNTSIGGDIVATVNGLAATGKGTNISINTADLAMSMDVANVAGLRTGFTIQDGGALFQLGPDVISSQQMRVGIGSMLTTQLGGGSGKLFQLKSGGSADLITSDASRKLADRIVNESINYVATTRGRLGAIQRSALEPNIAMLQDSLVALTEVEAMYSNADFAQESSNLTRYQLLVQAGMQTLGIANQFPQYAASLIR